MTINQVRSTAFLLTNGSGVSTFSYVVPAGQVAILTYLSIVNDSGPATTASAGIPGYATVARGSAPAGGQWQWSGRVVVAAGRSISVNCSTAGSTFSVAATGYLLSV